MRRRTLLRSSVLLAFPPVRAAEPIYPDVVPGYTLAFPNDHGSHPEFRTEWWYITGVVRDESGADLGMQVTFFRSRPGVAEDVNSRFAPRQLIFAHAALADFRHGRLRHDERAERAAFDLAGARTGATRIWIRDWSLTLEGTTYVARIVGRDFAIDARFHATTPLLLQGDRGYSRKGPAPQSASYYYSRPQLDVSGAVISEGRTRRVTGRAWLDHEWSTAYMDDRAVGWDWIGVNLVDGGALMAFRMRDRHGGALWTSGSRREASGRDESFGPDAVAFTPRRRWTSPRTSITYAIEFDVRVGGIDYVVVPMMDDQELDSQASTGTIYWEGAVRLLQAGREVGRGYLELTGYGGALRI